MKKLIAAWPKFSNDFKAGFIMSTIGLIVFFAVFITMVKMYDWKLPSLMAIMIASYFIQKHGNDLMKKGK